MSPVSAHHRPGHQRAGVMLGGVLREEPAQCLQVAPPNRSDDFDGNLRLRHRWATFGARSSVTGSPAQQHAWCSHTSMPRTALDETTADSASYLHG